MLQADRIAVGNVWLKKRVVKEFRNSFLERITVWIGVIYFKTIKHVNLIMFGVVFSEMKMDIVGCIVIL